MVKHRSVSQHNRYERCPYSYYLQRIKKVWQRPASWLSQGLGVHVAMEEWEKSNRLLPMEELVEIYRKEFVRSIHEQAEETPNFDYWFGSGPYSGPVDIERRFNLGEKQLATLVEYSLAHPEEKIWTTPEGESAIEIEFNVVLGGVEVKGFIDQVIETPKGIVVRDIKTGAKPGDAFQLATYAEAMHIMHGAEAIGGDYFMGKTGKPTRLIPISENDRKEVHVKFAKLEDNIQSERFDPKPSKNLCRMCSVATSCEYAV